MFLSSNKSFYLLADYSSFAQVPFHRSTWRLHFAVTLAHTRFARGPVCPRSLYRRFVELARCGADCRIRSFMSYGARQQANTLLTSRPRWYDGGSMSCMNFLAIGPVLCAIAGSRARPAHGCACGSWLSPERLNRITQYFQSEADEAAIPGAVLIVASEGRVTYRQAIGNQDRESKFR